MLTSHKSPGPGCSSSFCLVHMRLIYITSTSGIARHSSRSMSRLSPPSHARCDPSLMCGWLGAGDGSTHKRGRKQRPTRPSAAAGHSTSNIPQQGTEHPSAAAPTARPNPELPWVRRMLRLGAIHSGSVTSAGGSSRGSLRAAILASRERPPTRADDRRAEESVPECEYSVGGAQLRHGA